MFPERLTWLLSLGARGWRVACWVISKREGRSIMLAGRRAGLVLTHSITRFDSTSGTWALRSRGVGMRVSSRKLFSFLPTVKSVGSLEPDRVQYIVAPRLNTSVRAVTASHFTCSGAMKSGVPWMRLLAV